MLAIGYSERTEKTTIERLAETLKAARSPIRRLILVAIPPARSTMHLNTVFTVISREECLVYGPMILAGGAEEADVYLCDLAKRTLAWTSEKDFLSLLKAQGMTGAFAAERSSRSADSGPAGPRSPRPGSSS